MEGALNECNVSELVVQPGDSVMSWDYFIPGREYVTQAYSAACGNVANEVVNFNFLLQVK